VKPRIGLVAAAVAALLAGCVPRPAAPPPAPPPSPPPPPPAPPPPAPPAADWRDAPLSPGDWRYDNDGRSLAYFGAPGAPSLALRCDDGRVALTRGGAPAAALTVTTTFGARTVRAEAQGSNAVATLAPNDPLLDQMAFSRGRIMVEGEGAPALLVPAWPELARVIEDCRGGA
jgi:hypothetical protein